MFSTSSIIDNLNFEEGLKYKKLCRLLKISKKADKDKLDIALVALEKLEIINKNEDEEYYNVKDSKHLVAKIRCSSKGYCFAVRENSKEDIYIKENLLNNAWNGDKVLVRIIKEGYRRRSPEGIVDCILERSNQILLARVEIIDDLVYAIPIDDRVLSKIKLPNDDKKYQYNLEDKNIVKVQIDLFPIGQQEGLGHVVKELKLNNNEKLDIDFVLSKTNINQLKKINHTKPKDLQDIKRIDLSDKNSFMFKDWGSENSPMLPIIQIEENKDKTSKLWVHTNSIAERIDLSNKKSLEIFFNNFESFPLLSKWQPYLSGDICNSSKFFKDQKKEAISLCIELDSECKIINWTFHLTLVKCTLIIDNLILEALLTRKSKSRITSKLLKPIKEHVEEIDKIIEISSKLRKNQLLKGKIELKTGANNIESIGEFFVHNPADYSKDYFEPLNNKDCQTFLSPILYEADSIWFKHAYKYNIKTAFYLSQDLGYINVSDLIKNSELINNELELNDEGTLTVHQVIELCDNDYKRKTLNKLLMNVFKENEVRTFPDELEIDKEKEYVSPWTIPSYDFPNLINQYIIHNMIINGKTSYKSNPNTVNIMAKDSWENVTWPIFSTSTAKNIELICNPFMIDKINEYKNKIKQYRSNMISIKQVRKAEKLIGNNYEGIVISVQNYGFFVEIEELNVEGLVHVSTLNNDWYEYRSRQNLLIGRKSKKAYTVGDKIEVKIIKVDILKYQVDLEIT